MGCCSDRGGNSGPYAEGRELVEFVYQAHGGALRYKPLANGGLITFCQRCGAQFMMETHVCRCPLCGGVHAVSPPRSHDAANIQFAGADFTLPEVQPA